MPFEPDPGTLLSIGGSLHRVAEHPNALGMPYAQEGRAGTVYQLVDNSGAPVALKVFKARFRLAALVDQANRLQPLADVPGLAACRHRVLSPRDEPDLLRAHPDLTYAALMPWIDGPTWTDVILERRVLSDRDALLLASGLADVLQRMEERGLAHCDLSGPNVMLPALAHAADRAGVQSVELVDVETMFGLDFVQPRETSSGSPAYAHRHSSDTAWGPLADRFSGAVLLAEMLGWCDPTIRAAASGESYFDAEEVQSADSRRFRLLVEALAQRWGEPIAAHFERAWHSQELADCPTFGEWLLALPAVEAAPRDSVLPTLPVAPDLAPHEDVHDLVARAGALAEGGHVVEAIAAYRQARSSSPNGSSVALEVDAAIRELETRPSAHPVRSVQLNFSGIRRLGRIAASFGAVAALVGGLAVYRVYAGPPNGPEAAPAPPVAVSETTSPESETGPIVEATFTPTPDPTFTPTPEPTDTPVPSPTPTPTVDELWTGTTAQLESVWNKDWPAAIQVLTSFLADHPDYAAARDKLYAARLFYAQQLIGAGNNDAAVLQLEAARALQPDRSEAQDALISLTPTPTPAPTSTPRPPTQPPRPTPTPYRPPPATPTPRPARPTPTPVPPPACNRWIRGGCP